MTMREIKFRAWDKKNKVMHDRVQAGCNQQNISFVCHSVWDKDLKEWVHFDDYCGEIMQYTGLKDKNGKEIFEGDIIKLSYLSSLDNNEKVSLYKVEEMQNGYYAIKEVTDKQRGDSGLFLHFKRCEVVGNIYDNPELLKP